MVAFRPLDLVGLARQFLGPVQGLGHVDDAGLIRRLGAGGRLIERQFGLRRLVPVLDLEHGAGDLVRPIGGAPLAAGVIGAVVDVLEVIEDDTRGHVDGLRDRAVDIFLHQSLHDDVINGVESLGVDEIIGQRRVLALEAPEQAIGVIADLLFLAFALGKADVAGIGEGVDRLETGGNVIGEQRDGAGRRHRGQKGVADAVACDGVVDVRIERLDALALEKLPGVIKRKRPLLRRQRRRCEIGGAPDLLHPTLGKRERPIGAIARPAHDEGVAKPGYAEAHAPLGPGLMGLLGQGKARDVDGVVHHAHGDGDEFTQPFDVQYRAVLERVPDESRQVDRAQQTGAVGGQWLLAAVVDVKAIGIEGVEARNLYVEHLLDTVLDDRFDPCGKPLPVGAAGVIGEQNLEPRHLVGIAKSDEPVEAEEVLVTDDEFVVRGAVVGLSAAFPVRQQARPRRAAIAVDPAVDAETQQHPLHGLESGPVRLGKADAHALGLRPLDGTVGIEQATQEAAIKSAGSPLHGGGDRFVARRHAEGLGEMLEGGDGKAVFAATRHRNPAGEVAPRRQGPGGFLGARHDSHNAWARHIPIGRHGARPDAENRLVRFQRPVADQQTDEIAFVFR